MSVGRVEQFLIAGESTGRFGLNYRLNKPYYSVVNLGESDREKEKDEKNKYFSKVFSAPFSNNHSNLL